MGVMQRIKSLPSNLPTGIQPGSGIKPFLYDKGERAVMATALGVAKGYWYDKLVFRGVGIEAIVGVVGYLGSALLGGNKHLERAGDTGMTAYLYTLGASWGSDKAGRGVSVAKPGQIPGKKQVVGVIPPRASGPFLTADEIANYAQPR